MAEISITKQMSKILLRIDKKLGSSPTYSALDSIKNTIRNNELILRSTTPEIPKIEPKTTINLRNLYHESIGKFLKQPSPRSQTPETTAPVKLEERPKTPTLSKNSTQVLQKSSKFQPKLNKNSLKIAERLGNSKDRLTTSTSKMSTAPDECFAYKPEINKKSNKIANSLKKDTKYRWEALYALNDQRKKDIEQLKSTLQLNDKSQEECIFKPQVLQPSINSNPANTVERLTNWAKNREVKLKERKDNIIDKDMKECTFMPKIQETQEFIPAQENLSEIKGISPYIQRGKRLKTEKTQENLSQIVTVSKDINKKKYDELLEALHNELQSLEL